MLRPAIEASGQTNNTFEIVTLLVGARKLGREGTQAVGSPRRKVKQGCVFTEPLPSFFESLIDFCFQLLFFLSFLALVAFLK